MAIRRITLLLAAWCSFLHLPLARATPVTQTHKHPPLTWTLLNSNSIQPFRGLSAVSPHTARVAGANSTVLRTTDAGKTWTSVFASPYPTNLTIRDIEASSPSVAVALSIGGGTDSRIYRTTDAGATWVEAFVNDDPAAFYDCLAFISNNHGFAVSDPVQGKFRILETRDGGATWAVMSSAGMPPAFQGEAAFAASGTCLVSGPGRRLYLATGGVDPGRVFRSADLGRTWDVAGSAMPGGPSGGVYSIEFRDEKHGSAVGGDYTMENGTGKASATWTSDGGATWRVAESGPGEYRSGCAWVHGENVAIAVGPLGSDITRDGGRTWVKFADEDFDSVECPGARLCWASGSHGKIARLELDG